MIDTTQLNQLDAPQLRETVRSLIHGWRGKLACDDHSGYMQLLTMGVTEAGCLAHARRKFFDLWANPTRAGRRGGAQIPSYSCLVEREVQDLEPDERRRIRQLKAWPVAEALNKWLTLQRQKVPDGSATAKAIDCSLNRWAALTRYLDDGGLPADNDSVENQIRPIAIGRNNWLFAGSLRAGKRAAAVMSLVHSDRLNGPIRMLTWRTCSSACSCSPPAASRTCCRIAGSQPSSQAGLT